MVNIQNVVVPRLRDIGDFSVMRVLPVAARRMVGPFVFLDQFGPVTLPAGKGMDVRPHPHIGLSTVTYLLTGSIVHRDSLGSELSINPGDVNWMTAGRGIVHSERSDVDLRKRPQDLYGLQSWVALPRKYEETDPAFVHYASAVLPEMSGEGIDLKVIAGTIDNLVSPVVTLSPLFYGDVALRAGASYCLEAAYEERAAYFIEGTVEIDGVPYEQGRLVAFGPGEIVIKARTPARFVVLGGEPLDGPRHIYWNFVSSSLERIEQAKADWRRDQFGLPIAGEHEFIPLPD
ncbi:pirin family protein [Dongia rigui]|uniref:Pirin family protein n=1 Tax=Dongia rigui TaxID=940149 RepID=A0ABU5DXN4_9PROT|nr:pirin family protein [Dongia rigui]MDY0871473.1 pirin family protein [Dongia rigui]